MAEPLMEETTAAAAAGEVGCFPDEVVLLDFNSDLYSPSLAAAAGELQHQAFFFQDLFDPTVEVLQGLPAVGGGGGDEEEELEWLANKDAFPGLETSFEMPVVRDVDAVGEGRRPVLALAAAASFSAPVRPRSKGRTRRRTALSALSPQPAVAAAGARKAGAGAGVERRWCRHCQAEETPQWRAGPDGPKTLCNACGVRYKSGRLVPEYRPASSPTFSAAIHSNSHRRILEMRRQKIPGDRRNNRPPPPPPPPPLLTPMTMSSIK
ncbi:hypothetical protein Cni_G19420 [Canna indica]|uniref:GATA-type domain-containing protein n=1 Tax=Canna indica TaxID=4628 RepID=A0AAQ3KRE0_9LILI|nr:hypothetical protein Cni_G19420 [Canna indica]